MPGKGAKKVRFAEQNLFYSPPANITPPSSSVTTAPLSAEPKTRGAGHYLPGPRSSLCESFWPLWFSSSRIPDNICLHRYLESSAATWNLMDHPSTITRHRSPISSRRLREPATNPPQLFINVTSPYLPWSIKVHALKCPYVTVDDVLYAVYYSLRTNVTASEFHLLLSRNDRRRAAHAYEWRYRRHRNIKTYEEEKRGGVKRVDFLMGHTYFLGISNISCSSQPGAWQLNIAW